MNNSPYQMPNFMPYNPTPPYPNENIDIRKELEKIDRELEKIEKRLEIIENTLGSKNSGYLSSNVDSGKGLYMI